jgi:hypothetical protein
LERSKERYENSKYNDLRIELKWPRRWYQIKLDRF